MCRHDRFEMLRYEDGIMIRRCLDCGEVELMTEKWIKAADVRSLVNQGGRGDDRCREVG